MEANRTRHIRSGKEFDILFPSPEVTTSTIRKNADVNDTVAFIPKVVHQTLDHTLRIAQLLKKDTPYETCRNIWHFVYGHINYKKDQEGFEQIRSPARSWHDRSSGVDCDCYSVFISSILTNLGIPHTLRITKYRRNYFQHIYPVVPASPFSLSKGGEGRGEVVIDCVTNQFNYEVPFSEKKDYPMDLQYLSGLDDEALLYTKDGMGELGKLIAKKISQGGKKPLPKAGNKLLPQHKQIHKPAAKKTAPKKAILPVTPGQKKPKKLLNVINKMNPATVMLRNGVLASMKLNVKNVAGRLRWSYLPPELAAKKNINPEKFQKLIATRQKLENIFFKAGGKPDNLRKAILQGKGNKDKAVNGLSGHENFDSMSDYMSEYSPLGQVLGNTVYYSENIEGMGGFAGLGELGEPVTLTTIAAASGVIAGIVAALKQIGDIFQKKTEGSEDFDEAKNEQAEKQAPAADMNTPALPAGDTIAPGIAKDTDTPINTAASTTNNNTPPVATNTTNDVFIKPQQPYEYAPAETAKDPATATDTVAENNQVLPVTKDNNAVAVNEKPGGNNSNNNTTPDEKESFWDKNKSWIKPVAIGVGGITILGIGFALLKSSKPKNKSSPGSHTSSGSAVLSGVPGKRKKNHHRGHKQSGKHNTKKAVALL